MNRLKNKILTICNIYIKLNKAVKASLWFIICSIVQKGISVITLPLFTRLMSIEQYGQYNVFLTWYNILTIIITLNIQADIFNKGLIDHLENKDDFTSNQAGLLIFLTLFFSIIYAIFHKLLNQVLGLSTKLVIIMIYEILANAIIGLWLARKKFDYEYTKIVKLTLFLSIINPIVGCIVVLVAKNKAEARIISNAVVVIIVAFFILYSLKKRNKLFDNLYWWKPIIINSIPLIPHYLSLVLLNQLDKLMINYFVGAKAVAIYSIAHSTGLMMTIVNTSINSSFVPWVYNKIKKEKIREIKRISTLLMGIVLVVNLFIILLAPEIIKILAAPQYKEAIWCLVPISMSVFFFFVYTLFVDIEIYYGENNYIAIASIGAAILNLILNYVFIPRFGYIAAGYTTLASYFMTMILHYFFMKKILIKNFSKNEFFDFRIIIMMSFILCLISIIALKLYIYALLRLIIVFISIIIMIIGRKKIFELIHELKKEKKESII